MNTLADQLRGWQKTGARFRRGAATCQRYRTAKATTYRLVVHADADPGQWIRDNTPLCETASGHVWVVYPDRDGFYCNLCNIVVLGGPTVEIGS